MSTRPLLKTFEGDVTGRGEIVWIPYRKTHGLSLFPPIPISSLDNPAGPVDAAASPLPQLDDTNYTWI
ncbi:hypothetical protein ACWCQL_35540 [Streptomyces sp. NPDC002073]